MSANLKLVKFHRSLYTIFLLQENCLYNISSVSKSYSTSRCINTQPSPRKINPKLTVPPFFLEFHSVFSPTCHKIREEMITKFTTFSFSIDFLGVFFFLNFHPPGTSLSFFVAQQTGPTTPGRASTRRVGEGREVYQAREQFNIDPEKWWLEDKPFLLGR